MCSVLLMVVAVQDDGEKDLKSGNDPISIVSCDGTFVAPLYHYQFELLFATLFQLR